MQLISEEYRQLNAREHAANNGYGIRGFKHLQDVLHLAERFEAATVLDYGCGQGTLAAHAKRMSPLEFRNYDPSVEEFAALPEPADMVTCTDVMEHVEPMLLTNVIQHIAELTNKVAYFEIACRPARRVLADGRNAHLLIQRPIFWFRTISEYMDIVEYKGADGHGVIIVATPKGDE